MTPFWSSTFQSLGLIADIAGALLLFRFGLPEINRTGGANFLELGATDHSALEKEARYDRCGRLGIISLVIGFGLQLVPNAVMAVLAWKA
jgi:hypothetical protein